MKKYLALLLAVIMMVATMVSCGTQTDTAEESASKPAEELVSKTWKYDDAPAYIHISSNHTYQMAGKDMKPFEKVTFWNYLEDSDDTIVLYNEFGGESMTLTIDGEVAKEDNGDTLTACDKPMNGIYKCGITANFLDGDKLSLQAEIPQYIDEMVVQDLKEGSVLNATDIEGLGTTVEKIDKESDTAYRINDAYNLYFDEGAGAWIFESDTQLGEQIGVATITDDTVFEANSAGDYATLEECLKNVDGIEAAVEVKDGVAVSISVIVVE